MSVFSTQCGHRLLLCRAGGIVLAAALGGLCGDRPAAADADAAAVEGNASAGSTTKERRHDSLSERFRLRLDVSGELVAPAGRGSPPVRRPIAVAARFDCLQSSADAAAPAPGIVVRRYLDASADLRVADVPSGLALAADAREVLVALRGTTPAPYLAGAFLAREELELLETQFDPLLVDRLLPAAAVKVGERWAVPADATAGLLAIDTVEAGDLEASLIEVADGRAMGRLAGIVEGGIDGAPTHLVVEGTWSAPVAGAVAGEEIRLADGIATLEATIRERREASHVAPGFDVEARIVLARAAAAEPVSAAATGGASGPLARRRRGPGRPGTVWHREAGGRYDIVHDLRWRMVEDTPDGLVLRFVDHGALTGQCSLAALPRAAADAPPTIAEVERDVARSLGGQFGHVSASSAATRSDGVLVVRVVADGRADGLDFRWIHYVLSDPEGRRLAATFMVQEPMVKRFGTADCDLIDGVRLAPDHADAVARTGRPAAGTPDREARLTRESATP